MPPIPFALQWSIQADRLLSLKVSVNGCLFSDTVTNIPEFEYYLEIDSNGDGDQRRGETWIFFWMQLKNVKKVESSRTFTIESANFSRNGQIVYDKTTGFGFQICDTEEFFNPEKKYIVDKKFTVKVNGMFKFESGDNTVAISEEQIWEGGELGDESWQKDDTKGFTIIADGNKEIKVHKFILDVRSEVFAAMLNSNMKEAAENKVKIPDFSFSVVETGIKLIYHCTFTTTLAMDELISLLQFFDKYNLTKLKVKVEPYLIKQISASTVCNLTNASILTNSFCQEILQRISCIFIFSQESSSKTS